jgi:uncharacterized membrane protein YphA (DoxX/SURF4 family)
MLRLCQADGSRGGAEVELAIAVRSMIALVFLAAALGKLRHRSEFEGVLANYRLLPALLVAPAALALPPFELAVGALLLLGMAQPWPEAGAAALLLLFAAAMVVNLRRGRRHIDCGCFQSALKQTLSWRLVLRNLVLAAVVAASLAAEPQPLPLWAALEGVAAGAVLFLLLQSLNLLWSVTPGWRLSHDHHA